MTPAEYEGDGARHTALLSLATGFIQFHLVAARVTARICTMCRDVTLVEPTCPKHGASRQPAISSEQASGLWFDNLPQRRFVRRQISDGLLPVEVSRLADPIIHGTSGDERSLPDGKIQQKGPLSGMSSATDS